MVRASSTAIIATILVAAASHTTHALRIPLVRRGPSSHNVNPAIHGKLHKGDEKFSLRDHSFFGQVSLGDPPQYFKILFDTGSDILWVPSVSCAAAGCKDKNHYNGSQSSTYLQGHSPFTIQYGTGNGNFSDGYETFRIGNISIRHQHFGSAYHLADFFAGQALDGLMGLGMFKVGGTTLRATDSHNADPIVLPLQNMFAQGAISENLFSFWMNPLPPTVSFEELGGEISFGYIDHSRYVPPMHYYPLVIDSSTKLPSFWYIAITEFKIGDVSLVTSSSSASAVIDTGSSNILCPNSTLNSIVNKLNGTWDANEGLYSVSCDILESTLDFKFIFGGGDNFVLMLRPKRYIVTSPAGNCYLPFQVAPSFAGEVWILGDIFLENWYTVFDVSKTRVGFAPVILPISGSPDPAVETASVANTIVTISTSSVAPVTTSSIFTTSTVATNDVADAVATTTTAIDAVDAVATITTANDAVTTTTTANDAFDAFATTTTANDDVATTSTAVATTTSLGSASDSFLEHNHADSNDVATSSIVDSNLLTTSSAGPVITASVSPDHVLSVHEAEDMIDAAFDKTLDTIKSFIEIEAIRG